MPQIDLIINHQSLPITLYDNPVADFVAKCFYHLQHFPVTNKFYDNPYSNEKENIEELDKVLMASANQLGVAVNSSLLDDQNYLNQLHHIFEVGYRHDIPLADPSHEHWFNYHESIHLRENLNKKNKRNLIYRIDFRNLSGRLHQKFNRDYWKFGTDYVQKGQCFLIWCELGKTPYTYFKDKEPDDIHRLCTLAKPWLELKPILNITLEDHSFFKKTQQYEKFLNWFEPYKHTWCQHWNIKDWDPIEMFKVIPVGEMKDVDIFQNLLQNNYIPQRIKVEK